MATTCVLSAGYVQPDGTASAGTVEFVPTVTANNPTDDVILPREPHTATLDASGQFSVTLYRTDDDTWSPDGWVWQVTEKITGARERRYNIELTAATAQLADLAEATAPVTSVSYVLQATFDAHPHGVQDITDAPHPFLLMGV